MVAALQSRDYRMRRPQPLGEQLLRKLMLDPVGDESFGNFMGDAILLERRTIFRIPLRLAGAVRCDIVAEGRSGFLKCSIHSLSLQHAAFMGPSRPLHSSTGCEPSSAR